MRVIAIVSLFALVAACAPRERQAMIGVDDPAQRGSRLSYRNVTADAGRFMPVSPKGWEEINRRVAPKPVQ